VLVAHDAERGAPGRPGRGAHLDCGHHDPKVRVGCGHLPLRAAAAEAACPVRRDRQDALAAAARGSHGGGYPGAQECRALVATRRARAGLPLLPGAARALPEPAARRAAPPKYGKARRRVWGACAATDDRNLPEPGE